MDKLRYIQINNTKRVSILGDSIEELVNNVIVYRKNNKLKPIEYNKVFNQVRRQSKNHQSFRKSRTFKRQEQERQLKPSKKRKLTLGQMFHGARAYIDIGRGNIVSQTEINRRARICANCPKISDTTDCFGCGAGRRLVSQVQKLKQDTKQQFSIPQVIVGHRTSEQPISKYYCSVCSCSCIALNVSQMKHIRSEEDSINKQRPEECWMRKGGKNYIEDNS